MIDGHRVIAVVPARGGSKGLPRKNILDLAGRPLIAWTLEAARGSRYLDRCVVSTDDEEIVGVARAHGGDVPFLRPSELAGDVSDTFDTIEHVLRQIDGFDIVVILQPTSPLRTSDDIDGALEHLQQMGAPACVSVVEPAKSPFWSYRVDGSGRLAPLVDARYARMRRQDLPPSYVLNGAVYAARIDWLLEEKNCLGRETVAFVMPAARSIDIDTAFDLKLAEFHLQHAALR